MTEGRREEFRAFSAFRDPAAREKIPDPQAKETFLRSKLDWSEVREERHAGVLRLYRELLHLRHSSAVLNNRTRGNFQIVPPLDGIVQVVFGQPGAEQWLVLADLAGGHDMPLLDSKRTWQCVLCSNEARFGGEDGPAFAQPEVRVLRSVAAPR